MCLTCYSFTIITCHTRCWHAALLTGKEGKDETAGSAEPQALEGQWADHVETCLQLINSLHDIRKETIGGGRGGQGGGGERRHDYDRHGFCTGNNNEDDIPCMILSYNTINSTYNTTTRPYRYTLLLRLLSSRSFTSNQSLEPYT